MFDWGAMETAMKNFFIDFYQDSGLVIAKAVTFFVVGILLIKIIKLITRNVIFKSKLDNSAGSFVMSVVSAVLIIALFVVIISSLGFSTTGIIATFSAFALAIALALQNSLSSLANGVIIIFTKPFKAGDHIEINGMDGIVKSIRLFNTKILSYENVELVIPNSDILSSNLINYSSMPLRRINLKVPVSYDCDIDKVKSVLTKCLQTNKNIVSIPAPLVRLNEYDSSSINFTVRGWTNSDLYFDVRFDLVESIFKTLKKENIEIPYNKLDVKIMNDVNDSYPTTKKQTNASKTSTTSVKEKSPTTTKVKKEVK